MKKILIADCETEINKSLAGFFETLGYDAYAVKDIANVDEIVKETKCYKPDIAILDVRINGSLRLEIIDQIKELSKNTRVIVMSTYDGKYEQKIIHEISAHGADTYLQKPIVMKELIDAVGSKNSY